MTMSHITLARMNSGQSGKVIVVRGGHGLVKRLESMGIRQGVTIEKVSSQIMHGPVIVRIGMTQVAIGFGMSRHVVVEI
jgi:Fe2+ transport system protein FeoA